MIYIIGVSHDMQIKGYKDILVDDKKAIIFENHVNHITDMYNINIIIEEGCKGYTEKHGTSFTTCELIAKKLKIKHIFCDLNTKERKEKGICFSLYEKLVDLQLGIINEEEYKNYEYKHFDIRENEWMKVIRENHINDTSMLFVCGNNHISTMANRLNNESLPYTILKQLEITA